MRRSLGKVTEVSARLVTKAAVPIEVSVSENLTLNYLYAVFPDENGGYHAFLCDGEGEMVGGEFCAACAIKNMPTAHGENVFFGTAVRQGYWVSRKRIKMPLLSV